MGVCIIVSLSVVVIHSPLKYEKEFLFLMKKEIYKLTRKKCKNKNMKFNCTNTSKKW